MPGMAPLKIKLSRHADERPSKPGKLIAVEIKRWTGVARANKISVER